MVKLSRIEKEILRNLFDGLTSREIAKKQRVNFNQIAKVRKTYDKIMDLVDNPVKVEDEAETDISEKKEDEEITEESVEPPKNELKEKQEDEMVVFLREVGKIKLYQELSNAIFDAQKRTSNPQFEEVKRALEELKHQKELEWMENRIRHEIEMTKRG